MGPTPSIELSAEQRRRLIDLARESIVHGLKTGRQPSVDAQAYPQPLRRVAATFVTLKHQGRLRGCIGTLEAHRPLVVDVAEHAYAAAFRDPRFPPLSAAELPELEIEISILSAPEPLHFKNEAELLRSLRPGVDGLILEDHGRRGTFLPSVWESLPQREEFLRQLKVKCGLPPDYWSPTLRAYRYTSTHIGECGRELRGEE